MQFFATAFFFPPFFNLSFHAYFLWIDIVDEYDQWVIKENKRAIGLISD